jgi:hypothetical protein
MKLCGCSTWSVVMKPPIERDVRLMSSVTTAQDLIDADNEDEKLPADVVNFEQARAQRLAVAEAAKPTKYLIARTGDRYRRAHLWNGARMLCGKWSAVEIDRRREEFEVRDDTGGWDVCGSCEMAVRAALR